VITPQRKKIWRREELCYCSNVHDSVSEADLKHVVTHFVNGVRQQRQLIEMGSGLWINKQISQQLIAHPEKIQVFKDLLKSNGISLYTLNGFPYDNFHAEVVKEAVYSPDWSQPERYDYTLNLARILAACLPEEAEEGTISSLPLGFRYDWTEEKQDQALAALCSMVNELSGIFTKTGKSIRLCLEMEPDCVLQSTFEIIELFQQQLPAKAKQLGIDEQRIKKHLGICFDVCHQAVMFEDITDSLTQFFNADIRLGKIQISSALEIKNPGQQKSRELLAPFAEPKYLHQVRTLLDNKVEGVLDLSAALKNTEFPTAGPWRIHYHLPIQSATFPQQLMDTTQVCILDVLDFLQAHPQCHPHLEVETYTWNVLPESMRPHDDKSLIKGLTAELNWLERQMQQRGLLQNDENR